MARRRRSRESFVEVLFNAPWWVSTAIGVAVLAGLKWFVPVNAASSVVLKSVAAALANHAWLFSGFFFLIGLLSFVREKYLAAKVNSAKLSLKGAQFPASTAGGGSKSGWQSRVAQYSVQSSSKLKPDRVMEAWEAAAGASAVMAKQPEKWSLELLQALEWKRFEDVCQRFHTLQGVRSETTPLGPDGGIDIRLYQDDTGAPTSIVQCKAWGGRKVGIKPVRELLGTMTHEKIEQAVFMASGDFTDEARQFAQVNRITLITGEMLLAMIRLLPEADQQTLLAFASDGDFRTPTCPSCGIKMRHVAGTNGRPDFWGCRNYPRCRQKLGMRAHPLHAAG